MPTRFQTTILVAVAALAGAIAACAADRSDPVHWKAAQTIQHGDFDGAIRQLDEAIRLSPNEAKYRGLRGVAWIRKGDHAKGSADLKAAIAMNQGDAGAKAEQPAITLSPEALRHGEEQVRQMLRDRPAMAEHAKEAEFLRRWAARKFAGEDFGALIDWDPSPPLNSDAEHLAADDDAHAAILVHADYTAGPNEGKPRSFEELWAGAIYELYNVIYSREYVRLNKEADLGKLSKEAFVGGILKDELQAAQRTRAFYVHMFLPWMAEQRLATNPAHWFCDWWDTTDNVLTHFTDRSEYPWRPYGRTYDWAAVHRYWHDSPTEKTEKLLREMLAEPGYEDEQSDVWFWIGRCRARLGKPTEAVAAFSESIHLEPHDPATYRARAEQYEKLGEHAKAQADTAKAKELDRP